MRGARGEGERHGNGERRATKTRQREKGEGEKAEIESGNRAQRGERWMIQSQELDGEGRSAELGWWTDGRVAGDGSVSKRVGAVCNSAKRIQTALGAAVSRCDEATEKEERKKRRRKNLGRAWRSHLAAAAATADSVDLSFVFWFCFLFVHLVSSHLST